MSNSVSNVPQGSPVLREIGDGWSGNHKAISRRAALALGVAATSWPVAAAERNGFMRPFTVEVPDQTLERIRRRVEDAQLPRAMPGGWATGLDVKWFEALRRHWLERYDWRAAERMLNRFPQYLARVEDLDLHFYHVRGEGAAPLPLILTHGWPGSIREFLDVIDPLTRPSAYGGSAEDAFTVVIPSLPGFGYSQAPASPIQARTTARLWHTLMTDILGYRRYAAQGGDIGFGVTLFQALDFPDSLCGIHLNLAVVPPPDRKATTGVEAWATAAARYDTEQMDYLRLQMNKTQTVAAALVDSPIGTAAWIAEKFWAWTDNKGSLDQIISKDDLLTNIMLYLVTGSIDTSLWFYRGIRDELGGEVHPARYCSVPTAIAQFPKDYPIGRPPKELLRKWYNIAHFTEMPRGGHFAAFEQPELFVADVRAGLEGARA